MRSCFVLCFIVFSLQVSGKDAQKTHWRIWPFFQSVPKPDTLTLEHDLAMRPFITDTISVEAIKQLLGEGFQVFKTSIPNRFVAGQVDTLITIRKGHSYIRLYAVSKSEKLFYEQAEINDPLPVFKRSMCIGQTKSDIRKCLPELTGTKTIPDNILIMDANGMDYLFLSFAKDKLQKVVFQPYLD
ncbi:MAG: hypothetical protein COW65_18780 [Cytophagales bacterium CG18_big_fil_WC_8_21_14_2_50_42_9]|nr:MAG: hypothetical protein COW65_18780 [Cytophagales bacterium CG18_big_fil_WC_8_21_14_2_50_42_9]